MKGLTLLAALAAFPALAAEDPLAVPSGQAVSYLDTIAGEPGPSGPTLRVRFVAPQIAREGGTVGIAEAGADMLFLCENFALPRLAGIEPPVAQVIISLSDRPVEFGVPAPEATQFFEAYRPEGGACIWEGF